MTPALPLRATACLAAAALFLLNHRGFAAYALTAPGVDWAALGSSAAAVGLAALACGAFWGAGAFLLKRAGASDGAGAFGLGLSAVALLLLLLGLAGWLRPWATLPLLGACLLAGLWGARRPELPKLEAWDAALLALAAWVGGISLLAALAPPTDFDSLAHHLPIARHWAETGRIEALPTIMHSRFPGALQAAAAATLHLGDDRVPALLHLACALAAAVAVLRLGGELLGGAARLAAAAFLALPVLARFAPTAHNDFALTLVVTLSCLWVRRPGTAAAVVAGLLAGSAASFKYTGLWWALVAAALFPWLSGRRDRRDWAVFAACAAAAAAPWYVKNWVQHGNPVWPFFHGLFGGADWSAETGAHFRAATTWPAELLPRAALTVFADTRDPDSGAPFLLPAALAVLADRGRGARSAGLLPFLAAAALFVLPVAVHKQAWRMALPAVPILCLAAAASVASLWAERRRAVSVALSAALVLPALFLSANNALFGAAGVRSSRRPDLASRDAYLERALDVYPAQRWANAHLPADAKVLLFKEVRGYHLARAVVWGDPANQALFTYGPGLEQRLRDAGVTHVLINHGLAFYQDPAYYLPEWADAMDVVLFRGRRVYDDGNVQVFALARPG